MTQAQRNREINFTVRKVTNVLVFDDFDRFLSFSFQNKTSFFLCSCDWCVCFRIMEMVELVAIFQLFILLFLSLIFTYLIRFVSESLEPPEALGHYVETNARNLLNAKYKEPDFFTHRRYCLKSIDFRFTTALGTLLMYHEVGVRSG